MSRNRLADAQGGNNGGDQYSYGAQPAYGQQQQQPSYNSAPRRANPYDQRQAAPQQNAYPPQQQQQQQGAYGGNPYEMQQQPSGGGGGDFWQDIGDIRASLQTLRSSITQIKTLHAQSLNSTSGPPPELANLVDDTRALSQDLKARIKAVNAGTGGDKGKKQQVKGVKEQFVGLLGEYQNIEKVHRSKVKQRAERQFKIVKPDATPQEIETVLESDNPQIFQQALMQSNRHGQANSAYKEVQQRHEDIQRIEQTLTELAQLFNDMAMLIEQQDETIVAVETTAAEVNRDMEDGSKQLDVAIDSARKARRKKWICFWITLLILAIIAGVVAAVVVTQRK